MKVELIANTEEPEKIVSAAAKLCYSNSSVEDIAENQTDEEKEKFLQKLMSIGHDSPMEHITFTFAIEGVSRALTHQLVRHRIASYSQQSQRYVKLDQFEFVTPPEIEKDLKAKKIYLETMKNIQKSYNIITEILEEKYYTELLAEGFEVKKAKSLSEKKAIEDARYVFPNACETKIVVTMNARSLKNFFEHRCCNRAQWEIRQLAEKMLMLVKEKAPIIFRNSGPKCILGPCPEGKLTCGKIKEVRKKYESI